MTIMERLPKPTLKQSPRLMIAPEIYCPQEQFIMMSIRQQHTHITVRVYCSVKRQIVLQQNTLMTDTALSPTSKLPKTMLKPIYQ